MKNANMPAMPCEVTEQYHVNPVIAPDGTSMPTLRERKVMGGGMTKREMIATHMMAHLMPNENFESYAAQAKSAVIAADALLAELERTK